MFGHLHEILIALELKIKQSIKLPQEFNARIATFKIVMEFPDVMNPKCENEQMVKNKPAVDDFFFVETSYFKHSNRR